MTNEPSTEEPTPEMSDNLTEAEPADAGIRDIGSLLAAKRSLSDVVQYPFKFENWDGAPARIDFKLKRPVFMQGLYIGFEEAEASALEETMKWRREGDRSKEPKKAYEHAFYVARELVVEPKSFRSEDFVMALPPSARMELPRALLAAVGLGPKFLMQMRTGGSDIGGVLAELLRPQNSLTTSAAPRIESEESSNPEKSGPSSSPSGPTDSETVETES